MGAIVEWDTHTGEFLNLLHETPGYFSHDGSGDYLPYYTWSEDFSRVVTQMEGEPTTISTVGGQSSLFAPDEVITTLDVADRISQIVWSPDNTMLAVITYDEMSEPFAWVYDAKDGHLITQLKPSFFSSIYDVSWSRDSSMVALVSSRGIGGSGETEYGLDVLAVNPSSNEAPFITSMMDIDTRLYHAWHPENQAIAVSTSSGVGIYTLESKVMGDNATPIVVIPDVQVTGLAWSPNGSWLAGSATDGTVRVWDVSEVLPKTD